jgi:hypothetical protein
VRETIMPKTVDPSIVAIIPYYNGSKLIERSLISVVTQTVRLIASRSRLLNEVALFCVGALRKTRGLR